MPISHRPPTPSHGHGPIRAATHGPSTPREPVTAKLPIRRMAQLLAASLSAKQVPRVAPADAWVVAPGEAGRPALLLGMLGTLYEERGGRLTEWAPTSPYYPVRRVAQMLRRTVGVPLRPLPPRRRR